MVGHDDGCVTAEGGDLAVLPHSRWWRRTKGVEAKLPAGTNFGSMDVRNHQTCTNPAM